MSSSSVTVPGRNISEIKNKRRRLEEYLKLKREKQKLKRDERKKKRKARAQGQDVPVQVPRTLENTREPDETTVAQHDEEVKLDEASDEMSSYFNREAPPKVLITCNENPHTWTIRFCKELRMTMPDAEFFWRKHSSIKKLLKEANARNFTDIIVVNEDRRHPNGIIVSHLPDGPTAVFRVSNVKYCKNIKKRGAHSIHRPEVILNNFNTRLGHTVKRMLQSLFHYDPEFTGRRVVTFHNQRDYIFVRHHRYEFKNEEKVALQEVGPRFTLKLRSLQKGTFDSKYGEYEWVLKRHEMETSRRRFFL